MSKFDQNRIKDGWEKLCTNKQTNKQRNKQTKNQQTIMVTWPWTKKWVFIVYYATEAAHIILYSAVDECRMRGHSA